MFLNARTLTAFVLMLVLALRLAASGTYPPAPPRLPAAVLKSIDPELYNLGKALFTGRSAPAATPQGSTTAQAERTEKLTNLEARLPERARKESNAAQLAPRFTDREAEAVIYYVSRRFHLDEPPADSA